MAHYSFLKDLEQSKEAVNVCKVILEKQIASGPSKTRGSFKIRDLEKDEQIKGDIAYGKKNKEVFIEVKYDLMSEKTGNICFEIFNGSGKPTGILKTQADDIYYVVKRKKTFYVLKFDADDLRSWLFSPKNADHIRMVRGGDKRSYRMLLVPEKEARKVAYDIGKVRDAEIQV